MQQYDINPGGTPMLVRNVQHVPPPSVVPAGPPSIQADGEPAAAGGSLSGASRHLSSISGTTVDRSVSFSDVTSSEEEGPFASPHTSEERRDVVPPLSPSSNPSSSKLSRGSRDQLRRRMVGTYPNRYERSASSRLRPPSPAVGSGTSQSGGSTIFTGSSSALSGKKKVRVREDSLSGSSRARVAPPLDMFPMLKLRLSEVPFRAPRYPEGPRSVDFLRQEMLRTIFGWDGPVVDLLRYELAHHDPGSASAVLLSKWLGDLSADLAASLVGSESMTSSDWMLLALSAVGGGDSQKKVGDAFVQRLLEKGDVHPAVGILLGLGENNEAIEIYVSRRYYLEAVLLTCLVTPADWVRISRTWSRQWGEHAIGNKEADLAVRVLRVHERREQRATWFSPAARTTPCSRRRCASSARRRATTGSRRTRRRAPRGGGCRRRRG